MPSHPPSVPRVAAHLSFGSTRLLRLPPLREYRRLDSALSPPQLLLARGASELDALDLTFADLQIAIPAYAALRSATAEWLRVRGRVAELDAETKPGLTAPTLGRGVPPRLVAVVARPSAPPPDTK